MFTMSPRSRGWIIWLLYSAMLLTQISGSGLFHPAEVGSSSSCDHRCAFLKASKCIFLQLPVFICASDEVEYPPSVTALLDNLPANLKNSILDGNFQVKNREDLLKISPSILNLIPVRMIQLNAENVSTYLHYYSQEPFIAEKLIDCLNSSVERKSFLENLSGDKLSSKMEDVIATALSKWQKGKDWNFLQLVESNTTVLLHMPPQFLLSLGSKEASEFLFHLGSKFTSPSQADITRMFKNFDPRFLKYIRKIWAMLAARENPDKITWNKYNFLLPGLTLDELKNLEVDEIKPFFTYDLRAAQVRIVVSKLLVPWRVNYNQVAPWVKHLSAIQIQKFRKMDFDAISINADETASYATAKQILLYRLLKLSDKKTGVVDALNLNNTEDLLQLKDGFISVLPLKIIQQLCRSSVLTLQSLQKIDTNLLSLSAAYYLTDEGNLFNIERPELKITAIQGLLRALPTSKIMALKSEMSSILLHHLLQYLQGDNILRNLELLKKCRPTLDSADHILKFLLENDDKNEYFSLLSPKDVAHISLETVNSLNKDGYGKYIKELPPHILSSILSQNSFGSWTWSNMINGSNSFDSLLMGLNCNEMRKIEDSDFISIIGHYNDNRMKMNKAFPKNLQRCGQIALARYLRVKSQLYNERELLDLLEPSDIKAVGGYILAALSAEEILQAKHSDELITAIGQLSLPELLLAASHYHFSSLTDEFLNQDVKMSDLLLLKNLIHFISVPNLEKINPENLRYIIESDFIDKRLCANSEMRNAWSHLLISAFGQPSKWNASQIESLGDLMIALPPDQLDAISSSQWQILADISVSKYADFIEWPKSATFYQACLSTLVKSEQKSYLEAIKALQRKYFEEVQKLVGSITVSYAEESFVLLNSNETSFVSYVKPKIITPDEDSIDSDEEEDENVIGGNAEDNFSDLESDPEESDQYRSTTIRIKATTIKDEAVLTSSTSSPEENVSPVNPISAKPSEQETVFSRNTDSNVESRRRHPSSLFESNVEPSSHDPVVTITTVTSEPEHDLSKSNAFSSPTYVTESRASSITSSTRSKEQEIPSKFTTAVSPVSSSDATVTDFSKASSKNLMDQILYLPKDVLPKEEEDGDGDPEVYGPEESIDNLGSALNSEKSVSDGQVVEPARNNTKNSTSEFAVEPSPLATKSSEQIYEGSSSSVFPPTVTTEVPNLSEIAEKVGSLFFGLGRKKLATNNEGSFTVTEVPIESKEAAIKEDKSSSFKSLNFFDTIFGGGISSYRQEQDKVNDGIKDLLGFGSNQEVLASTITVESTSMVAIDQKLMSDDTLVISGSASETNKGNFSTVEVSALERPTKQITRAPSIASKIEQKHTDDAGNIKDIPFFDFDDCKLKPSNLEQLDSSSDDFNEDYDPPEAEIYGAEVTGTSFENDGLDQLSAFDVNEYQSNSMHGKAKHHAPSIISVESVSNLEDEGLLLLDRKSDIPASRSRRDLEPSLNRVFCDSVKILGPSAALAIQEADIHATVNEELVECVEDLGKLDLPLYLKEVIWQRVKSFDVLKMAVGTLAAAWKMDDVNNLSLDYNKAWNLEIIHLLSKHNTDSSVGLVIVDKVRKQIFANGTAKFEIPEAVMVAMGPLLCYLSERELESIFRTPGTFMHVMPVISKMIKGCPMDCLAKLSKLAVVFMDSPDLWTSDMVSLLGSSPAGLDHENWKLLTNRPWAISGLQPAAAECLPQTLLQVMSLETMSILPPLTVKALSDKHLMLLSKEQKDMLIRIRNEHWTLRNSSVHRSTSDKNSNVNIVTDLNSGCGFATSSFVILLLSFLHCFCLSA